jgi:hypothetical protein
MHCHGNSKLPADGMIAAADLDFGTSGMAARGLRAQYIRRSGRAGRVAGQDDYASVTSLAAIQHSQCSNRSLVGAGELRVRLSTLSAIAMVAVAAYPQKSLS